METQEGPVQAGAPLVYPRVDRLAMPGRGAHAGAPATAVATTAAAIAAAVTSGRGAATTTPALRAVVTAASARLRPRFLTGLAARGGELSRGSARVGEGLSRGSIRTPGDCIWPRSIFGRDAGRSSSARRASGCAITRTPSVATAVVTADHRSRIVSVRFGCRRPGLGTRLVASIVGRQPGSGSGLSPLEPPAPVAATDWPPDRPRDALPELRPSHPRCLHRRVGTARCGQASCRASGGMSAARPAPPRSHRRRSGDRRPSRRPCHRGRYPSSVVEAAAVARCEGPVGGRPACDFPGPPGEPASINLAAPSRPPRRGE